MHPIIARFGPVTIYSYGLMIGIAFLSGIYVARLEAIRKGIKIDVVYDVVFYLVIGALIGARIYYLAFFEPAMFIKDPLSIFKIWQGGIAIHGAILGGILAGLLFSKFHHNISFFKLADLVAPSLILGQAVGRIGCFLNSCCFGIPSDLPWAVNFPEWSGPYIAYGGMAVHPTQLYEVMLNIIGFFILWSVRRRIKFDGGLFLVYLMMYNCYRIAISGLRGDNLYLWNTNLKIAPIISGLIFITAFVIFIIKKRRSA